jgi:serine/threonine-protein kinase
VTRDPAEPERLQQAMAHLKRSYDETAEDGAIAILERLASANPDSAVVFATLARAYFAKFKLTAQHAWEGRAATAVERAGRLAPEDPDVLVALGEMHLAAGHSDRALGEFDRAQVVRPAWFDARLGVARALYAAARYDDAEAACRAAITLAPEDWRGHDLLGTIQFKQGRFAVAVEAWTRVLQLAPDNARAASNLGSALFHLNRHDEALTAYRRSIQLQPNQLAFTNIGTVLFYLERYEEATDAFEKAVALSPSDPLMWGNLGSAARLVPSRLLRAREALERAIGLMQEVLAHNPENFGGWSRLAGWLANLLRNDDARRALQRALQGAPENVHVMVHAGNVYCQLGEPDEAFRWLERAVRAGFGVDAIRHAPDLAALRDDPRFVSLMAAGRESTHDVPPSSHEGGIQ